METEDLLSKLPLDVIGKIITTAGTNVVFTMACLSKWWYSLGSNEMVWREQCFLLYDRRMKLAENHHQLLAGVKSFTEQKGDLTWKKYWTALKLNAHFLACSNCRKYPLFEHRYDCINCVNFTLCLDCENKMVHPKSHILARMDYPVISKFYFEWRAPTKTFNLTCSACSLTPLTGSAYCNFQTNKALCSECIRKLESAENWYEQKLPEFELFPDDLLGKNNRGAYCDVCSVPSIPINWKCTCCYDYDLCNKCLQEKKHTKKHAIMKLYWARWARSSLGYLKPSKRWKDGDDKDESDYEDLINND